MDITSILEIENIWDYKFHAARYNTIEEPLDVFLRDRSEWDRWNSWQSDKNEFNRDYVVSFIQFYPQGITSWLFGGIYKILGRRPEKNASSVTITNLINYFLVFLPYGTNRKTDTIKFGTKRTATYHESLPKA